MSDDEDSQGYIGSIDTEPQADSIDDFLEDTISVSICQMIRILRAILVV